MNFFSTDINLRFISLHNGNASFLGKQSRSLAINFFCYISSGLDERSLGEFETRCALAARGVRKSRTSMTSGKKKRPHSEPENLRIDRLQAAILPNTQPLATEFRK